MSVRLIYLGLGLIAIAAIALGVVFGGGGDPVDLPGALRSVSPQPGDQVTRQAVVEVILEVGYAAEIHIDGFLVSDVAFVEAIGVYRWAPSPTGITITEWTPGVHTVRVVWDTVTGLPDPGEFEWSFRVMG